MPKAPYNDPKMRLVVYVHKSVLDEVELLCKDPLRNKPKYGAITDLVNELLSQWITTQRKAEGDL